MAGTATDKEKLNHTLEKVCSILNENNINDWFIFFGTLLGIVRENSCIQGDDDLDIMISIDSFENARTILLDEGFKLQIDNGRILKTKPCDRYGSIDFYVCNVNASGDFHTPWHGVISTNSYLDLTLKTFITKDWKSTVLNLPKDYEQKLVNMYGDWKTPSGRHCPIRQGKV